MLTSEVIERKLPTLNTKRFSESTCDALLSLVLRECSSDHCVESETLDQIASQDSNFANWIADLNNVELDRDSASVASPSNCRIYDRLVRDPSWRDATGAAERLWQAANIALRLKILEQRFSDELTARKREAIYHFAYGLSHELNNPLANIATRAGVLAHGESAIDRRQMLDTIIDNAMRGSEMLGDLMLIARPPKLNLKPTHPRQWFEAFVNRCADWANKRDLKILSKCDVQQVTANFDPVAITEAGWCLVRNAFEASRSSETIEICFAEVDRFYRISISDFGVGLSSEALQRCFDPYYSGREAGRGLGLGLSKAHRIATTHGGDVKINNRPGGGCEALLTWSAEMPASLPNQRK